MSDTELMEAAAKAAGYECVRASATLGLEIWDADMERSRFWHPLRHDGDALDLAMKLELELHIERTFTRVWTQAGDCIDHHEGDKSARTRRAIVRAAAAIGKDMP